MEKLELTPRLAAIAAQVPQGARLADIGTDHGKLPLYLLKERRVQSAIGSDIGAGPLAHARANAKAHSCMLDLRQAPGLDAVQPDECDTISIAGMGGQTIAAILSAAPWALRGGHLLLLQPMTQAPELRQWLWENGCIIEQETVCREDGRRWYAVLQARGGAAPHTEPLCRCYVSEALMRAAGAKAYFAHLLRIEMRALGGMKRGRAVSAEQLAAQRETVAALQRAWEDSI